MRDPGLACLQCGEKRTVINFQGDWKLECKRCNVQRPDWLRQIMFPSKLDK